MNKNVLAVNIGKTVAFGLKLFRLGSGTSMPGIIARKFSPRILSHLVSQTTQEIIAVTGTNGKTTTANFVSAILKSAGRKVANNAKGANMLTGVTTAMIENADHKARIDADNAVFETDEAYVRVFADYFTADYLIITNLFKDQLDRYGEVDATAKMIKEAIDKFKLQSYEMAHHLGNPLVFTTILNADDPSIQHFADYNTLFFGFEDIKFMFENEINDIEEVVCSCGKNIKYSKNYYGQIGHYSCSCGFKRPETLLKATAEIFVDYSILNIFNPITGEKFSVKLNMPGVYNAYNALAAITLTVRMGISSNDIIKAFEGYETVFGRAENIVLKGKNAIIQLIKNPVGAEEVLKTVKDDKNAKILIAINDNFGDGRDVSWLWDTKFEILKGYDKKLVVSGNRYADLALRLKYAGIKTENIILEPNLKNAVLTSIKNTNDTEKLYILPCYTALIDMQKFIKNIK